MTVAADHEFKQFIQDVDLPPNVSEFADKYEQNIGIRSDFLWRWMYSLLPNFRLSCVSEEYHSTVREEKTLFTMFITTLDDLAERGPEESPFAQARMIPFAEQSASHPQTEFPNPSIEFATKLWQDFESRLQNSPRYREFVDMFEFDFRQSLNAMEYAQLVSSQPDIATLSEAYRYDSHNMVLFLYATIDLMYSPSFDRSDLTILRETLRHLQQLARIGNWTTTWKRELQEGDFSSGVVISALQEGVIEPSELTSEKVDTDDLIRRIDAANVETCLNERWHKDYENLKEGPEMNSVDRHKLLQGMKTVRDYHLQSRGLK